MVYQVHSGVQQTCAVLLLSVRPSATCWGYQGPRQIRHGLQPAELMAPCHLLSICPNSLVPAPPHGVESLRGYQLTSVSDQDPFPDPPSSPRDRMKQSGRLRNQSETSSVGFPCPESGARAWVQLRGASDGPCTRGAGVCRGYAQLGTKTKKHLAHMPHPRALAEQVDLKAGCLTQLFAINAAGVSNCE